MRKTGERLDKTTIAAYQNFIEAIVLMTDSDYLDSVGFEFGFIECPEKIYDLLASVRNITNSSTL